MSEAWVSVEIYPNPLGAAAAMELLEKSGVPAYIALGEQPSSSSN